MYARVVSGDHVEAVGGVDTQPNLNLGTPWFGRPGRCTEAQAADRLGTSEERIMELIGLGELRHVPASPQPPRLPAALHQNCRQPADLQLWLLRLDSNQ